ncbi:protein Smaug homolog 2-like isoform X2 [Xenia sp. Carnegie-2017]|nr:protein Smaug homolog 2-like isoform X2 [Xenia sp. Carnegie-2017]XP_046847620.1 protein Smaug homolog 2-like isoform X2 [Xenia sp. Carnegie-2017]
MRPANAFRSQIHTMQKWFTEWNECERTIALYYLLRQMTPVHARFLSVVMEHHFRDHKYRTQMYEEQANDREFLISLTSKPRDEVVKQLLLHLPLLQPGNHLAREEYLKILPLVLTYSRSQRIHEDECRQLLSLALVHPAFPADERNRLQQWLDGHEKCVDGFYDAKVTADFPPVENPPSSRIGTWQRQRLEKKDSGLGGSFEYHQPTFNPPGLPPPAHQASTATHSKVFKTHSLNIQPERTNQSNGGEDVFNDQIEIVNRPGRSQSFPVDPQKFNKIPLSPQSSIDSETDEPCNAVKIGNYPENPNPGMRDYILWLKSLRLHKYAPLFSKITYDNMFNLAEKELESKNVTKGAMTKIMLSIKKLKERSYQLSCLEKEVHEEGKLSNVLESLKAILHTPIKPFFPFNGEDLIENGNTPSPSPHPDDLPSQLTKVIGKACTQLLVSKPNDENFSVYISLLEKALNKEAFTAQQKKRLQSWKQQCLMSARRFNPRRGSHDRGRWPYHGGDSSNVGVKRQRGSQRGLNKLGIGFNTNNHGPVNPATMRSNTTEGYYKPRQQLQKHALVSRTKSAPIPASKQRHAMLGMTHQASTDSVEGINDSLESLCWSMTEHALADNSDCS